MHRQVRRIVLLAIPLFVLFAAVRPALAQGEPETIERIIREGRDNSKVWVYLSFLAEEIGPRLTGSSRLERANNWTREMFESFGCHAYLHKWGEIPVRFDRGPSYVRVTSPVQQELAFTTRSWGAGTDGPVSGRLIKEPQTEEELAAVRDQLEGAWVLAKPQPPRRGRRPRELMEDNTIVPQLWEAGIAGRITASSEDQVRTGGERNWRELAMDKLPTDVNIIIARKDYDMLNSRLADGEDVELEANLDHKFVEGPIPLYNTVAEIPGTEFPEQVVIVSAHLDSWDGPGSQGAQDNGTGSAVTLEAARILMAAGVKPRRTIRFILWTGEEQGLLGSREYVNSLSDEEKANISAAFVDDGGTNYQGGLHCVEDMAEMLRTATEPVNRAFPSMPVEIEVRESMPRGGASDHASFNRAGIPGFFWREDGSGGREGKDYRFIHHTQNDTTRYAVPEYLVQAATCSAITAYNLAMAEELLPRAPAPATQPSEPEERFAGPFTPAAGPLTGTWTADIIREGNVAEGAFSFTLEHSEEGRIRGHMFSRYGEGRLRRVQYDPQTGELSFLFNTEMGGGVAYRATVKGEEMTGTLGNEEAGFSMEFKARRTSGEIRQPEAAPPQGQRAGANGR